MTMPRYTIPRTAHCDGGQLPMAGDITLGLILAVLAAYYLAMIWAGIVMAITEPREDPAPPTATQEP